ncbi:MAG: urease accessory protein UreE [Clostridium sp.]
MILDKILGNTEYVKLEGCHVEVIYLNNEDMGKKFITARSDHGTDYGIMLPEGVKLKNGDILLNDGYNVVVVKSAKEDVLKLRPKNLDEMGEIAHYIGNKHVPAQFLNGEVVIQYDAVIEENLKLKRIEYVRDEIELQKGFKVASLTHRH